MNAVHTCVHFVAEEKKHKCPLFYSLTHETLLETRPENYLAVKDNLFTRTDRIKHLKNTGEVIFIVFIKRISHTKILFICFSYANTYLSKTFISHFTRESYYQANMD